MPTHDDFNELEAMLSDLPVREPSQMLDARVAATLETTPRTKMPWLAIAAAVLLAAAVTLVIVLNPGPAAPTNPPITDARPDQPKGPAVHLATNRPDTLNLTLSRDIIDETRYTPTGEPYRTVVREAVDHKAWSDPETGTSGHLCIPREELIVVKQSTF